MYSLKNAKNILYNKITLYLFFFLSLADLLFLSVDNDVVSIVVFFIIGFITSFFSKNMVVVLFISIVFTNILKYGTDIRNVHEGMCGGCGCSGTDGGSNTIFQ